MATRRPYRTPDHGRPGSDYGSSYEQRQYIKTHARQLEGLMRQFCNEGPQGNSSAYTDGWERIFGKKEGHA